MAATGTYFEQSLSGLVPVADQQAFKIAFYNASSIVFIAVVSFLFWGVYHLLQAFIRPIIWAVLCGTVLFPFKKTVASCTEYWLEELNSTNTPFLIGLILIPLRITDKSASLVWKIVTSKDAIIFVTITAVFVGLTYQNAFNQLINVLWAIYSFLDSFISVGSSKWAILTSVIYVFAFVGYLHFGAEQLHKTPTRFLSVPIWVAVLCVVADLFGVFRVIVFGSSSIIILLIVLRVIGSNDSNKPYKDSGEASSAESSIKFKEEIKDGTILEDSRSSSNKYIYIVFGGCCFLWILQSPIVLSISLVIFVYAAMKKLGECFGIWQFLSNTFDYLAQVFAERFGPLIDLVIPSSIRQFVKLIYYGDKQVIESFKNSAGVLSSIIVMIGLVLGLILMSVFLVFQLKDEATHLAQLSGNLINRTLSSNPQYAEWFTNATNLGGGASQLDSMVDDAFKYSRNWLSSQARLLAKSDDSEKADLLEAQVKMLVDKVYELYTMKNAGSSVPSKQHAAVDLFSHMKLTSDVSLLANELVALIKENVGMLVSVLDTVWSVLKSNLQFVFSLLFAFVGIILSLGLEVLNFVIGTLVFFTMMYYLLALSKEEWKPIEMIKMLTPATSTSPSGDGLSFSSALEQAVRKYIYYIFSSVFILSFKMSTFYGLYAYFIHTLFSLNVVILPSILAAVFASIPFLAPYWLFLPGALELYLVRGETASAVLFLIFSFLPTMFIDAAFYEEVRGSHPYLTGLAIVGGIYWLGLEGALIGPMLLCCMLVTLKMYRSILPK